ncbi:MAG: 6-phosphogluconolactonase [Acidimicrobiales bacterium]
MLPSPPHGELRVVDDVPAAFSALLAEEVSTTTESSPEVFRLALSGGSTARACYEHLATVPGIDWGLVHCFVGDERCVPPDDADANQRLIRQSLLDRLEEPPRFHPMDCARLPVYSTLVGSFSGFDFVHLGLGPDGHTASIFPGSAALEAPPDELVMENVDPSGRNPHRRGTLTFLALARAKLAVFTVSGPEKRDALSQVLRGDDLPAGRVASERVIWLCDQAALGPGVS